VIKDVSERVRFDFDGFKITMTGSNPADWPQFEMGEALHSYTLPTAVLGCAMAKTYSSISSEETRYYLNGTYVHVPEHSKLRQGKLTFVSTDGHCMCRFEVDAPVGATPAMAGLILPRKAVLILDKLCKRKGQASYVMTEHRTAGRMRFRFGHLELATRTIDGTFPDYHRVIPSGNDKLARVDVAELKEKIGQVSRIHTGKCQSFVRMSFSDGNLELTCYGDSGESARAVIPADYSSGNLDIGFNHRYVLDILDLIEGEVIEIKLADPGSPAIFAGADDQDKGVSWVLMPMRV
jgi:DNA polymerase-3 subunit beta